jgi:hypothetical protein
LYFDANFRQLKAHRVKQGVLLNLDQSAIIWLVPLLLVPLQFAQDQV